MSFQRSHKAFISKINDKLQLKPDFDRASILGNKEELSRSIRDRGQKQFLTKEELDGVLESIKIPGDKLNSEDYARNLINANQAQKDLESETFHS